MPPFAPNLMDMQLSRECFFKNPWKTALTLSPESTSVILAISTKRKIKKKHGEPSIKKFGKSSGCQLRLYVVLCCGLCCAVLCCAVFVALRCVTLCVVLRCVQCMLCYVALCFVVLCCVLCYVVLCCVVLYCTAFFCVVLRCVALCCCLACVVLFGVLRCVVFFFFNNLSGRVL